MSILSMPRELTGMFDEATEKNCRQSAGRYHEDDQSCPPSPPPPPPLRDGLLAELLESADDGANTSYWKSPAPRDVLLGRPPSMARHVLSVHGGQPWDDAAAYERGGPHGQGTLDITSEGHVPCMSCNNQLPNRCGDSSSIVYPLDSH